MASRMDILTSLQKTLSSRGWKHVYNCNSGILWKKGCLFVFGNNNGTTKEIGCMHDIHHEMRGLYEQSGNSWYIERGGWIVATGEVTRRVGDAAIFGESDERWSDWIDIIEEIDSIPDKTSAELSMHKKGYLECEIMNQEPEVFWVNESIRNTSFFGVVRDISELKKGRIYQMIDVSNGAIVIALLNTDLRGYERTDISAKAEILMKLEKAGYIKSVEIRIVDKPSVGKGVCNLTTGKTKSIPRQFNEYGLDGDQLISLSKAVASVSNVTPLLNNKLHPADEFLEALKESQQDLSVLASCSVTKEATKALAPIIRAGYNIAPYVQDALNADYISLQFNDTVMGLDEMSSKLAMEGFDRKYIEAARVAYTFNCSITCESKDSTRLALELYGKQFGLHEIIKELSENGMSNANRIFMRWGNVKSRAELYSLLSADGIILSDGTEWNQYLSKIFDRALYVIFEESRGILVSDDMGLWGRDYNSIVLYGQLLDPIWRAIKVNEEFISYGNIDV